MQNEMHRYILYIMDKYQSLAVHVSIRNSEGKYLISKRSADSDFGPNMYDIPGGKVPFGEDPNSFGVRKVFEEVGVAVTELKPIFIYSEVQKEVRHQICIVYECKYNNENIDLNSDKFSDFQWINIKEYANYPMISVAENFFKFLEQNS